MNLRRAVVIVAISLTMIRLVCLILVPLSAASPSLLLVVARPAGETILLSTTNASSNHTLLVATLAFFSRLAFDIAVFAAARYSADHLPGRWTSALPKMKRILPPKLLVALVTMYSATVLVVALAVTEVKAKTAVICLSLNSLFTVFIYVVLAKSFNKEISFIAEMIDRSRMPLTLILALAVGLGVLSQVHNLRRR